MSRRCRGKIACALASLALVFGTTAHAERLWLLIGASDTSAATIAKKAKVLASKMPTSLLVQTRDCGERKNVFAWVAMVADSRAAALAALPRVKQWATDAYIKPCEARPASLLALRINAIDPSIADVPADAVNWREEDRVSSVRTLDGKFGGGGDSLLVTRYFATLPNDPLEGRRERISLVGATGIHTVLDENCMDVANVAVRRNGIALQCAREQAADTLLHSVLVFDTTGKKLAETERCRNPRWIPGTTGERAISCESESVDGSGRLSLHRKRVALPRE